MFNKSQHGERIASTDFCQQCLTLGETAWAQGPAALLFFYCCLEAFFSQPLKTSRDTIKKIRPTGRQFYLDISHNTTSPNTLYLLLK
jgi:hypothetical protein